MLKLMRVLFNDLAVRSIKKSKQIVFGLRATENVLYDRALHEGEPQFFSVERRAARNSYEARELGGVENGSSDKFIQENTILLTHYIQLKLPTTLHLVAVHMSIVNTS